MSFSDKQGKSLVLLLFVVMACGMSLLPPPPAHETASGLSTASAAASMKISSSLRHTLERLRQDGITTENVARRQVETYTTPLVRIDRHGRIQVDIRVSAVDDQVQLWLRAYQVDIDFADAELRLVQAWVPFDRLEEVATLAFVRYIRPPSYAVRRSP